MPVKHTVQLKMPKIFNRKKKTEVEEKPDVTTEVHIEEVIKIPKEVPQIVKMGGVLAVGLTVGYLAGFKDGVSKGGNIVIMK